MAVWVVGIVVALIFCTALFVMERRRHTATIEKIGVFLTAVSQQRQEALANELFAGQHEALQYSVNALMGFKGVDGVAIYDLGGQLVLRTGEVGAPSLPPVLAQQVEQEALFLRTAAQGGDYALRLGALSAYGEQVGYLALYSNLSALERDTTLYLLLFAGMVIVGALLTSGLLHVLLARFVLAPLTALQQGITNLQAGRWGDRVPVDGHGEIADLAKAFNEMSAKLQEQQACLRESEERYRAIYENAVEGICQTAGDGRFLGMNNAMARMLGYASPEEAMANLQNLQEQISKMSHQRRRFRQLLQERGQVADFEACFLRRDETPVWVAINANAVFNARGAIARIDALVSDISIRKKAEEEVRSYREHLEKLVAERTEELSRRFDELTAEMEERRRVEAELQLAKQAAEDANQAKSRFLASMSHEIRTPMNAIMGMAEMLMETELSAEQKSYVDLFCAAGQGLMTVLNDILDLSRVESGHLHLEMTDFDLADLLEEAMGLVRSGAAAKGLDLRLDIGDDVALRVHGDPHRLRQVLHNLLANAVKFTRQGSVTLSVRPHRDHDAQYSHEFCVTDTGIGIPKEKLEDIFESFNQVDNSISREFGGAGLGLAISRWLLKLMGGSIWAESTPGQGSSFCFVVDLPQKVNDARPRKKEGATCAGRESLPPLRVLLVEDSEYNAFLVASYFKSTPFILDMASNGRHGVDKFSRSEYDVVLMDVQMPVMDGLEATRAIRELEAGSGRHVPIIALTAHVMGSEVARCREAGCDAHVAKPVARETLLAAIMDAVKGTPADGAAEAVSQSSGLPGGAAPSHKREEAGAPLRTRDVSEDLAEIVPLFLDATEKNAARMLEASFKGDFQRVRDVAHQLQGEGAGYGFPFISESGKRISDAAKAHDGEGVRREVHDLLRGLEKVRRE